MSSQANTEERLRNVYWIGGGPGGGKSTIARRLADHYGMHLYATDDVMSDHARRSSAIEAPYLERFKAMSMDERWLNRTPEIMLETFHWFRGEGFALIVEDLLRLPAGTRVVAEGFRLLPHLVQPLLPGRYQETDGEQAVWLLPTPEFRRFALERRGSTWTIPGGTSDPQRAQLNLSERDRMFTDRMIEESTRMNLRAIQVDGTVNEDDMVDRVALLFQL